MTNAQNQPQDDGKVVLYKNPQALTKEAHGDLGLLQIEKPFNFAATTHVVPLTVQEFGIAATSMPIIFAPDKKTPLAVLGARSNENLFVGADGNWELDVYIPAFVRRYPFIFAADDNNENFVVFIDQDAEMLGKNPVRPLFNNGELSDYSQGAIQFLQDFENQRRATEQWADIINKFDLLEDKVVTFTPTKDDGTPGETLKVADYIGVSEEKLNALSDADLLELKTTGALGAIYAHLVSLLQWQKMVQKTLRMNPPVANA